MAVGATIAAMMKATGWQYAALLPGVLLQSCRATAATQDAPSHSQDLPGRKSRIKVRHLRGAPVLQGFG
jgi:hypothetical protein